jgi:hypothetical protein
MNVLSQIPKSFMLTKHARRLSSDAVGSQSLKTSPRSMLSEYANIIGAIGFCIGGFFFAGQIDASVKKTNTDIARLEADIAKLSAKVDTKLDSFVDVLFNHHDRLARYDEKEKRAKPQKFED